MPLSKPQAADLSQRLAQLLDGSRAAPLPAGSPVSPPPRGQGPAAETTPLASPGTPRPLVTPLPGAPTGVLAGVRPLPGPPTPLPASAVRSLPTPAAPPASFSATNLDSPTPPPLAPLPATTSRPLVTPPPMPAPVSARPVPSALPRTPLAGTPTVSPGLYGVTGLAGPRGPEQSLISALQELVKAMKQPASETARAPVEGPPGARQVGWTRDWKV